MKAMATFGLRLAPGPRWVIPPRARAYGLTTLGAAQRRLRLCAGALEEARFVAPVIQASSSLQGSEGHAT